MVDDALLALAISASSGGLMFIGCFLVYGYLLCYQPVKTQGEALGQLQHVMPFPMKEGANAESEIIYKVTKVHQKDRKR